MRGFLRIAGTLFVAVQAFWVAFSLYQSSITVAGRAARRRKPPAAGLPPRFYVAICARNEQAVVANIVGDLLAQDYPRDRFVVTVIAHNCTDSTPLVAAAAGATVIELSTERPGKAAAVRAALGAAGAEYDFIAIFDADARIPNRLLAEVAAASPNEDCLQVETVPHESHDWLVEGYGLGRRVRNALWWRPREALGLGTTVTGSGWFIRPAVLRELIPQLRTITEDLELTARICSSGRKVAYVSSTYVIVEEPHDLEPSMRQRVRWARGHFGVVAREWRPMARRVRQGDFRSLDMALYLVAPTRMLSRLAVTASFALALFAAPFSLPLAPVALAVSGEWFVPAFVVFRDRLLPPTRHGMALAIEHAALDLLWFPIGLWALVTPGSRAWVETPRSTKDESDAIAAA
jgi:cellulose synthase/poly-beta-1,6-N-acetylglucosamine synthase-like glycosyltransferase